MSKGTGGRRGRVGGAGGGAAARRAERSNTVTAQMPHIRRKIPEFEILDEEALAIIEHNGDVVMEEIGVEYRDDPEALAMWKEAGADVKGQRVHFPVGLCRELMKTAPSTFTQHARNPERNVQIGGKNTVFAPVYGPPFVCDLEGVRRYATMDDFRNFVKMAYMAPAMHHSGGTVCEPTDVAVNKRHLDMLHAHMTLSDKPYMGSVTAPERAEDSLAMSKILFSDEFVDNNCVMTSLINCNSPLVLDDTMLGALKVYGAGRAGNDHIAVYRWRCDVTGYRCRHVDAGSCRGNIGDCVFAVVSAWSTGDFWNICNVDIHAVWRSRLWHPGAGTGVVRRGTVCP